jgi:glutathione-specific gamma-glutamylcyclotransferase
MWLDGEAPRPDSYYSAAAAALIEAVPPDGDVWLFAFGSLIWNKRFTYDEERPGMVRGWHRDFCLGPDIRFRGNPRAPGYTLSLDRGGNAKAWSIDSPAKVLQPTSRACCAQNLLLHPGG